VEGTGSAADRGVLVGASGEAAPLRDDVLQRRSISPVRDGNRPSIHDC